LIRRKQFIRAAEILVSPLSNPVIYNSLATIGLAVAGILASVNPGKNNGGIQWLIQPYGWWLIGSSVLLFVGSFTSFKQSQYVKTLENKIKNLEEASIDKQEIRTKVCEVELKTLIRMAEFGHSERISLYSFDRTNISNQGTGQEQGYFSSLAHYSLNPTFGGEDIKIYPLGKGCLGIACENGECFVDNLPDPVQNKAQYFTQLEECLGIPMVDAENLKMKSRSFYGYTSGSSSVVIVFESTKPNGIDRIRIKDLMQNSGTLIRLEHLLNELSVPQPVRAANEGF
jgi:hypothetical protein